MGDIFRHGKSEEESLLRDMGYAGYADNFDSILQMSLVDLRATTLSSWLQISQEFHGENLVYCHPSLTGRIFPNDASHCIAYRVASGELQRGTCFGHPEGHLTMLEGYPLHEYIYYIILYHQ